MASNSSDPYAAWEYVSPDIQANQALVFWLLGPAVMGILTHVFLFGVVISSFFHYLASDLYNSDSRKTRWLAWSIVSIDFLSVIFNTVQAFFYFTTTKRDPVTLVFGTFVLDAFPPFMAGVEAILVHLYLVRRASRLFIRQRKMKELFLISATTLCILSFIASLVVSVFFFLYFSRISFSSTSQAVFVTQIIAGCWLSLAAFIDCGISLTLTLLIRGQLKALMSTEGSRADGVLRKVMALGLETALYTSLMATAGAITTTCFPASKVWTVNVFFAFTYPLPSLYAFSFLVTLRSREKYREMVNPPIAPAIASVLVTRQTDVVIDLGVEEESQLGYGGRKKGRRSGRLQTKTRLEDPLEEDEKEKEFLQL